jgi:hypothetical protein
VIALFLERRCAFAPAGNGSHLMEIK